MEYTVINQEHVVTISLSGSFTFRDNEEFRNLLSEIATIPCSNIVCDVKNIEFVDSAALGMFLLLRDIAEQKQADVILKSATGQVKKMFEISKFSQLFILE